MQCMLDSILLLRLFARLEHIIPDGRALYRISISRIQNYLSACWTRWSTIRPVMLYLWRSTHAKKKGRNHAFAMRIAPTAAIACRSRLNALRPGHKQYDLLFSCRILNCGAQRVALLSPVQANFVLYANLFTGTDGAVLWNRRTLRDKVSVIRCISVAPCTPSMCLSFIACVLLRVRRSRALECPGKSLRYAMPYHPQTCVPQQTVLYYTVHQGLTTVHLGWRHGPPNGSSRSLVLQRPTLA